jgi:hypothetical protein
MASAAKRKIVTISVTIHDRASTIEAALAPSRGPASHQSCQSLRDVTANLLPGRSAIVRCTHVL